MRIEGRMICAVWKQNCLLSFQNFRILTYYKLCLSSIESFRILWISASDRVNQVETKDMSITLHSRGIFV